MVIKSLSKNVLEKGYDELEKKGKEAQQWVLENKNNVIQTKRIVELYQLTIC